MGWSKADKLRARSSVRPEQVGSRARTNILEMEG
jgi:hypothetical protein